MCAPPADDAAKELSPPLRQRGGERVVIYSASFFKIDGVTLTIRGLLHHILASGGSVLVVTADDPTQDAVDAFEEAHRGTKVVRAPGGLVPVPGADYYVGIFMNQGTQRVLEEFDPTVVHITNPDLFALSAIKWVLRQRPGCALTATLHSNYVDYAAFYRRPQVTLLLSMFMRHLYSLCPSVYVPTEFMVRKMVAQNWDTRLGVWGRGVDGSLFCPGRRSNAFRERLGLGPADVAVLWVGRVVLEKQPETWAKAVEKVRWELQEEASAYLGGANPSSSGDPSRVLGVCVGDGEARGSLEGREGIVCLGWMSGEALATAVASCDVLVFPSEVETFGRVTLEAMSSGVPCVVNRECGAHLVQHGENGFTVPVGDAEGYVSSLRALAKDRDLRTKMGAAGRKKAQGYLTTEVYDSMLEIYRASRVGDIGEVRRRRARVMLWSIWDIFGLTIYCMLELSKLFTAAVALATHRDGANCAEVKLCLKAFGLHLRNFRKMLLQAVGAGSRPSRPQGSPFSTSYNVATAASAGSRSGPLSVRAAAAAAAVTFGAAALCAAAVPMVAATVAAAPSS